MLVGGLFSWFLTIRQFYCRQRKITASILVVVNLAVFFAFSLYGLLSNLPWDTLGLLSLLFSIVWILISWALQYTIFGKAHKRFYISEWQKWLTPITVSILLGIGLSVIFSTVPIITDRISMYMSEDILTKEVILWDFFRYTHISLLISIPIGLWFAGERERFSSSHIISYIFGLLLFITIYSGSSWLFFFVLNQGSDFWTGNVSPLMPPTSKEGLQKFLFQVEDHGYIGFFIIPLFLGYTPRIRDFLKRSLVIFPLLTLSFFGFVGYSQLFWHNYQEQILFNILSSDPSQKERSYQQVETLLNRYPNHQAWPEISLIVARHLYSHGNTDGAADIYRKTVAKTHDSLRWLRQSELAQAVLNAEDFGNLQTSFSIELPPINFEPYMTSNWMALLRLIRYFEYGNLTENQSLIGLKEVSTSESEIELSPMPTLAELDDNAANLGYKVLYLPSRLETVITLIRSGFPVIQPIRDSFYLLAGLDNSRNIVAGFCYEDSLQVIERIKKEQLGTGIFDDDNRAHIDAHDQSRIDSLGERELPFSFWQSDRQQDIAAHIAVLFPDSRGKELSSILQKDSEQLKRESDGYLAAFITLNSFKSGDIINTIKWSRQSYLFDGNSSALHTAHLTELLWRNRVHNVEYHLDLARQLPDLHAIENFLASDTIDGFLRFAEKQFYTDLHNGTLSWSIRQQYKELLDRSDLTERQHLIAIAETDVRLEPESRSNWLYLADLSEWNGDFERAIESYEGALKADLWNDFIALKLAYLYVQTDEQRKLAELLRKISTSQVKFEPDFYYCKATVLAAQQQESAAERLYKKAIAMRRYDPNYHLDYADFLEKHGKSDEKIKQLRDWADRLSIGRAPH
jgi:hypothetical protein